MTLCSSTLSENPLRQMTLFGGIKQQKFISLQFRRPEPEIEFQTVCVRQDFAPCRGSGGEGPSCPFQAVGLQVSWAGAASHQPSPRCVIFPPPLTTLVTGLGPTWISQGDLISRPQICTRCRLQSPCLLTKSPQRSGLGRGCAIPQPPLGPAVGEAKLPHPEP